MTTWFSRARASALALVLVASGVLAAAGSAVGSVHRVHVASLGNVRAVLAYDRMTTVIGHFTFNGKTTAETQTTYAHMRASVFVGGRLLVSQLFDHRLQPFPSPIHVKDVAGTGDPVVLVNLYTGGAHCCEVTKLYLLSGARLVGQLQRNWGDPGYRLVDINGDGALEFETQDDAFAYAFTDYADSARPLKIWSLNGSKLIDTTADFPGAIAADARGLLKAYNQAGVAQRDVRGILPAYVADEAMLGTPEVGWDLVNTALADGDLDHTATGGPTGNAYVAALRRFLAKYGYS